jgi:hypothetical protein
MKNLTNWSPPSGKGYVKTSTGSITTQSGLELLTQSGVGLLINPEVYTPEAPTSWSATSKEETSWTPPSGEGYIESSGDLSIKTQSGLELLTQSLFPLTMNPNVYKSKFPAGWTLTPKYKTGWTPPDGQGYVITVGAEDLTTNSGFHITDNLGNQIVTTPTYDKSKNTTRWTE